MRAQLLLDRWQLEALRSIAEREGGSISSVVRRILTEALRGGKRGHPGLRDIAGAFRDEGFSARDHDALLYGHGAHEAAARNTVRESHESAYGSSRKPARKSRAPRKRS